MDAVDEEALTGWPTVTVQLDGLPVEIGPRTAEMIRQLVAHQDQFERGLEHGDIRFSLQVDRVKIGVTRMMPSRRMTPRPPARRHGQGFMRSPQEP